MRTGSLILAVGVAGLSLLAAVAHGPVRAPHASPGTGEHADNDGVPIAGSYQLAAIKPAADGSVLDHRGRSQRLAGFTTGRITILSFIYTNCGDPEGCPLAMATLFEIYHASEKSTLLAGNARLV